MGIVELTRLESHGPAMASLGLVQRIGSTMHAEEGLAHFGSAGASPSQAALPSHGVSSSRGVSRRQAALSFRLLCGGAAVATDSPGPVPARNDPERDTLRPTTARNPRGGRLIDGHH